MDEYHHWVVLIFTNFGKAVWEPAPENFIFNDLVSTIQEGFEEAISTHMASLSYKLNRTIEWDSKTEKIIALPGEDLDAILLADQEKVETEIRV